MGLYSSVARPVLFRIPPEASHRLAEAALRVAPAWAAIGPFISHRRPGLDIHIAGIPTPNPVGLAAGFDKTCRVLGPLLDIGFGFVVGGTVTLQPRPGNARPRLFRNPAQRALVNALGFPGDGVDAAERRLRRLGDRYRGRVLVSVAGTETSEVVECHRRLEPWVAGVELNISSPNTAGLRVFQEPDRLRELIRALGGGKRKPLLVKMPRLTGTDGIAKVVRLGRAAVDAGADGLVVANTLPVEDRRLAVGRGGLSGAPLFASTEAAVAAVRKALPAHAAVVACGGVFAAQDVRALKSAGADAVQLYTAFIYEGPGLPGRICRELAGDSSLQAPP